MSIATSDPCLKLSDESLSDARRLMDMLSGAQAPLFAGGQASIAAIAGARSTILEARAVAELLCDRLERFFAWQAKQDRNVHAQAGKHVSNAEVRR